MKFRNLIILILFCINSADAQWNEGDQRSPVPDTEWQKSNGDFGAILLITNKPNEFFENWEKPPSPDYKPQMATVSEARRGDVVMAIVLFSGCAPNKEGNCSSQVGFKVINPDGSIYADHAGGELWSNKPAIPVGNLQVSVSNLGFEIEPHDQLGEYLIQASVKDLAANKEVFLTQKIAINGSKNNINHD